MKQMRSQEETRENAISKYSEQSRHKLKQLNLTLTFDLYEHLQTGIIIYLQEANSFLFAASNVCEYLMDYHDASNHTYSSGTYKIFPDVCEFLEELTKEGVLKLVEKKTNLDRIYQIVDNAKIICDNT